MTTLDPILDADELRVYLAAVMLHDEGVGVTPMAVSIKLAMPWSAVAFCFEKLQRHELLEVVYRPTHRVEIDRGALEAWRREVGR